MYFDTFQKYELELRDRTSVIENPFKFLGLHVGANIFPAAKSEQTEDVQVSEQGYNNNPWGPLHIYSTNTMFLGLKLVKKLLSR